MTEPTVAEIIARVEAGFVDQSGKRLNDAELSALIASHRALEAELKALRRALQPFAKAASATEGYPDDAESFEHGPVTPADYRRAEAAFKAVTGVKPAIVSAAGGGGGGSSGYVILRHRNEGTVEIIGEGGIVSAPNTAGMK